MERVAVLGGGVMGETLVAAMRAAGRDDIVVAERDRERARAIAGKHGVEIAANADAAASADIILIVVKPQDVPVVLADISDVVKPEAVVVSLAAGVRTSTVEAALPAGAAVVRAMPNTPALVGEGMFGVSAGSAVPAERLEAVVALLSCGGLVEVVDESAQDAVTAVSGSGPAYVFYLAEAMIDAGVAAGLDPAAARVLTTQTLVGAAKLLSSSPDVSPEELRRRVTSPNGTTFAATATFDEHGVDVGLRAGIAAAAARSAELG